MACNVNLFGEVMDGPRWKDETGRTLSWELDSRNGIALPAQLQHEHRYLSYARFSLYDCKVTPQYFGPTVFPEPYRNRYDR